MFRLAKIVASGVMMIAAAYPLRDRFLLIPIAVGAVVFCVAVVILRVLTQDEKELLRRVAVRLPVIGERVAGSP